MAYLTPTRLRWIAIFLAILGLGLLVLAGVQIWSQRPLDAPTAATGPLQLPPPPNLPPDAAQDPLGRLTAWPGKTETPCPAQEAGTAVILILGQSNAGNHAALEGARATQPRVFNWSQGQCYLAASPLLGATGQAGEPWTLLADQLLASQQFTAVVIAPIAVQGSPISRWVPGGDIDQYLVQDVRALQSLYRTTHVVWLQGEADFAAGTSEERYRSSLLSVVKTLHSVGVRAPFYVSTATRCTPHPVWRAENPVALAQNAVVNSNDQILSGVNMDQLLAADDRFDGCHLSAQGLRKVADAWSLRWTQQ